MAESKTTYYYKDTGCRYAKKEGYYGPCLECPFDECFEEINYQEYKNRRDEAAIRKAYRNGMNIKQLQKTFRIGYLGLKEII